MTILTKSFSEKKDKLVAPLVENEQLPLPRLVNYIRVYFLSLHIRIPLTDPAKVSGPRVCAVLCHPGAGGLDILTQFNTRGGKHSEPYT
ncbi:hypothetical protein NQ318_018422 [Aromia moschata]|uniref:Uncharacterized protein n=1 Tax=Aromia moschata TaxID=1265417 RepID=A0AAV8XHS7_9CUCU|nr:hypothetical protein NQ318_018422 [Aromia moschata]